MAEERYFEDYVIGRRTETASLTVTEEDMLAFARAYDPQYFHLDAEQAKGSLFGGLVASGWQIAAYTMRLMVESACIGGNGMIGVGVDGLRWLQPVRPGDVLHALTEIESKEASKTASHGIVRVRVTTRNQHERDVLVFTAIARVERRPSNSAHP